jgi:hypothetical protein
LQHQRFASWRLLPLDAAHQHGLDLSTGGLHSALHVETFMLTVAAGDGVAEFVSTANRLPKERKRKAARTATKKIAIIGKAPSSKDLAPYADESWEIWGLADLYTSIPRWSRWFELHEINSRIHRWGEYWEFIKTDHGKPVYLREPHPDVPHGVVYPKAEIVDRFCPVKSVGKDVDATSVLPYFTNQVSWMIALAMHEGATDIGLWGVDMAQHGDGVQSEYAYQRPSCEFFLGLAAGRGIRCYVHECSDLLKARRLYGFDSDTNAMRLKWKARHNELNKELQELNVRLEQVIARQNVMRGHLDEISHWPEGEFRTERETKCKAVLPEIHSGLDMMVKRQHVLLGALDDMNYWREWSE